VACDPFRLRAETVPTPPTPLPTAADDPDVGASWRSDAWRRIRFCLLLKATGITAFMWLFFLAYFQLLRHPVRPVLVMPLTPLDRWIPFQPAAFAAYVSLWLYVGIPPGLMLSLCEAAVYGLWMGALCLAGLGFFYLVPTAVPTYGAGAGGAHGAAIALLQGVDAAGNACPSLHVATAAFTAIWVHHLLGVMRAPVPLRALNWIWLALIVHSTLAIKQHVVIDVLAGTGLAAAFAWPSLRWRPATRV
jgi:hypothetical protein